MIGIGIDIGLTGAVAAINAETGDAEIFDLPIREAAEKRIDVEQLLAILQRMVPAGQKAAALIEDIRVRTMTSHPISHKTENSLANSRGIVQAALDISHLETLSVQPTEWKRFYGLIGAEKSDALVMARKLYPDLEPLLRRAKDHNRAESLLIAHYLVRKLG